jgi:ornithine decarboxylase
MSAKAFKDAVISARAVFDQAASVGFEMTLLDVGGGFPGNSGAAVTFDDVATVLGDVVDELFPKNVRVIAEPGKNFQSVDHAYIH